jgi:hypothetical protein
VRFDDKLETAMAQPADDAGALAAVWAQIVDILAQGGHAGSTDLRKAAFQRLADLRDRVPLERRRATAAAFAGRPVAADLFALFGNDAPVVAASIVSSALMDEADWLDAIPLLSPASRALLRERRDLPQRCVALLQSYGVSDFALPVAESAAQAGVGAPIHELVERIERFRRERRPAVTARAPASPIAPLEFRFEAGVDGLINWVDGVARGPLVGIDIGTMAEAGEHGVDGHAAGAFRRRTPFRDARMLVPGQGPVAGDWLISGLPRFRPDDGRFTGFRGTARRPRRMDGAGTAPTPSFGGGLAPDALRQLVHELRTPLNAMRGFAEMIEGQFLGPVSAAYRQRAADIVAEAGRVSAVLDDVDVAARLERGVSVSGAGGGADMTHVLHDLTREFGSMTDARQVHLRVVTEEGDMPVAADGLSVERMLTRLVGAAVGLAARGEGLDARLERRSGQVRFTLSKPQSLKAVTDTAQFDTQLLPKGDWPDAPALGLDFALRLVGNLARSAGGTLDSTGENFVLSLPAAEDDTASTSESV